MQSNHPACWEPRTDADRVMLGLSRTLREVRAMNDRAGLDFGSAAVLFTVAHHADGIRISEVAERIHLDLSTVSRHARALEDIDYLGKVPDPADRRACLVSTTDQGDAFLQELMQRRAQLFAAATADWDAADVKELADLLDRLASRLTSHVDAIGATA